MKANKTDNHKKASKKAEKKALEQSLTTKLFDAVKSLGHDAEKISEDLILVSKFVAKKISKRMKSGKDEKVVQSETANNTQVAEVEAKPKAKKVAAKVKTKRSTEKVENPTSQETALTPEKTVKTVKRTNPVVKATKSPKHVKAPTRRSKPSGKSENEHVN